MNAFQISQLSGADKDALIEKLSKTAIREGDYTFEISYVHPQPTSNTELQETCYLIVQGGEIMSHDANSAYYGNAFTNAAYAMFNRRTVDAAIQQYKHSAEGAMNGTGGRTGAVMCAMRAIANLNKYGKARQGMELNTIAVHVFEKSAREEAMDKIRRGQ